MVNKYEDDWKLSKQMCRDMPLFLNWELKSIVVFEGKNKKTVRVVFKERGGV